MKRFALAAAAVTCVLSGCAIGPNYRQPSVETPEQYKEAPSKESQARESQARESQAKEPQSAGVADSGARNSTLPEKWWRVFNDPKLDELEERVAVSNQNLAAAEASYRQATAIVSQARASFFPFVNLGADASRSGGPGRSKTVTTGGTGTGIADTRSSNTYQASATAGWEIDLWGRLRRSLENAHALADASAADLAFARLSLQAQLATAYLQLREADSEVRMLSATVDAYSRALQIAQNRYNVGMAAKVDVLQARTQLANAQEQSASIVLSRAQLEHAIAALVGAPASNFSLKPDPTFNAAVPVVPAGVPSVLLAHRPDIESAERRVAAANADIGVQEAAYLPSLTLNGTYEFLSTAASTLFKAANEVHTVAASASQTLFDAGTTRARVSGARAAYDQSVAEYRQSVLTAFQDVEDQLAASRQLERQHEFRRQASEAADESERLVLNQYRAGTVSFTNVVVAQTAALSARVALSQIAVQRQTTAIALIQATGGGWKPEP